MVATKNSKFIIGDRVSGFFTWTDFIGSHFILHFIQVSVSDGANLTILSSDANIEANLGVMGLAGMTAYFGLFGLYE